MAADLLCPRGGEGAHNVPGVSRSYRGRAPPPGRRTTACHGAGRQSGHVPELQRRGAVYGGDGEVKEVAAGCAGVGASARALAAFISKHAVWGNGGRAAGYARSGSTPGTSTWAESRGDGVDFAFVLNTRDWPPNASAAPVTDLQARLDTLLNSVTIP